MQHTMHLCANHFQRSEHTHHLDATSRATRARANDAHQNQTNPSEVRPKHKVFCCKSRGAHHRHHIEERLSESTFRKILRMPPLTQRANRRKAKDEKNKQAQFLIVPKEFESSFKQHEIE